MCWDIFSRPWNVIYRLGQFPLTPDQHGIIFKIGLCMLHSMVKITHTHQRCEITMFMLYSVEYEPWPKGNCLEAKYQ